MSTIFQTVSGENKEVELPVFTCHKTVRAAKVLAITYDASRGTYRLALDGACHVDVTRDWITRRSPHPGGYFVLYEDGYSSFSSAPAFEQGYAALKPAVTVAAPAKVPPPVPAAAAKPAAAAAPTITSDAKEK